MYKFYNAHPKGLLVKDCVKRAISRACDMDYHDVTLALNRYKKVTGAKKFNSDRNPEKWVENEMKARRMSFPAKAGQPRMNGDRFCKAFPKGKYILQMAGHWTCCVDGVIYDTWNCTDKCVYKAWEIKPELKQGKIVISIDSNEQIECVEYVDNGELKNALKSKFESVMKQFDGKNIEFKFIKEGK